MRDTVLEQYLAKMGFLRDDYIVKITHNKESQLSGPLARVLISN